jgi:hypothetical protein
MTVCIGEFEHTYFEFIIFLLRYRLVFIISSSRPNPSLILSVHRPLDRDALLGVRHGCVSVRQVPAERRVRQGLVRIASCM